MRAGGRVSGGAVIAAIQTHPGTEECRRLLLYRIDKAVLAKDFRERDTYLVRKHAHSRAEQKATTGLLFAVSVLLVLPSDTRIHGTR